MLRIILKIPPQLMMIQQGLHFFVVVLNFGLVLSEIYYTRKI